MSTHDLQELLKVHVQELRVLKERLPADQRTVDPVDREGVAVPASVVDPAVISPLVTIYEKRVHELQTLNSTLVRGRDTLEAEVRRLAHENELLREAKLRDLQRGDSEHQSEEQHRSLEAAVAELKERMTYVEEERHLLLQQKESLADELDQVLNDRSEQDSKLAAMATQIRELQFSRSAMDQLGAEKAAAEERVVQLSQELGNEQQRMAQQEATSRELESDCEQLRAAVQRAEAARQAAEKHGEDTDTVLQEKVQTFAGRIRDLQSKLAAKTNDCEARDASGRTMRRELDQVLADNKGMVLLMGRMEKQLADFGAREEKVESAARACKDAAEKALLERDTAVATEAYLRGELERLREARVKEYEDRAAQHEAALAECRGELTKQLRSKEAAVDRLISENERLRVEMEAAAQSERESGSRLSQLSSALEAERRSIGETCRSLEERAASAEARALSLEKEADTTRSAQLEAQGKLQRSVRDTERKQHELDERRHKLESDLSTLEYALEVATAAKDKAERDVLSLSTERDTLALAAKRVETLQREVKQLEESLGDEQQKVLHLDMRVQDANAQLANAKEVHAKECEFLKGDKLQQESLLTSLWERDKVELNATIATTQALNLRLSHLSADLAEAQANYQDAQERANKLESAFDDSQQRLSELSIAVAEASVKEQARLREYSKLKAENARLSSTYQGKSLGASSRWSGSLEYGIRSPAEGITGSG